MTEHEKQAEREAFENTLNALTVRPDTTMIMGASKPEYENHMTQLCYEIWQARGEYEQQRVRKLVETAQAVIASASYMQQMTESGQVYCSPEMAVPILDMETLRHALSEYTGESK